MKRFGRLLKKAQLLLLVLALCAASPAAAQAPRTAAAPEDSFSFYGLKFGMSPEEVRQIVKTNAAATEVIEPGHGMMFLVLDYDYRNRLGEIRASYERPGDRLREFALRLALKERFQQPITARWRSISADIDEGSNRAAIALVLVSLDLRQEAVDHFKDEFLQRMK